MFTFRKTVKTQLKCVCLFKRRNTHRDRTPSSNPHGRGEKRTDKMDSSYSGNQHVTITGREAGRYISARY